MNKSKVEKVFAEELSKIQNPEIRDFVIIFFDELCPSYFWTCPCSASGKYHPKVSLGKGGLVRHTKLAVWWGIELLTAQKYLLKDISKIQLRDEVIATLLLHDMRKNGRGLNAAGYSKEGSGIIGTHGTLLAEMIRDCLDSDGLSFFSRILAGIAGHMGVWTTDTFYKPDSIADSTLRAFANLIHLADFCASKKVDEKMEELKRER